MLITHTEKRHVINIMSHRGLNLPQEEDATDLEQENQDWDRRPGKSRAVDGCVLHLLPDPDPWPPPCAKCLHRRPWMEACE